MTCSSSSLSSMGIPLCPSFFFFNDTATTEIYTLSLHDALPISPGRDVSLGAARKPRRALSRGLSDRKTRAGASHHDHASGGAGDRGVALRARAGANSATDHRLRGARIVTTSASLLHPEAFLSPLVIAEAVQRALNEDLGRAGDAPSIATNPEPP